jgi:23S rRNA (cytosine1962-C5)-methyltransferase
MTIQKGQWIDRALVDALESGGTNAHRLCTIDNGWVERFDRDVLISFRAGPARDRLLSELQNWAGPSGFDINRVFERFLPKKNEQRQTPKLLSGQQGGSLQTVVSENELKFGIDFSAGYSVGLFVDQRENRKFVRQSGPKRMLNCFAYTCSFSVAAASAGAHTMSIDLSKKSLERGQQNFFLNSISTQGHQFIADDVRSVLRRLGRRGEKFDTIILDPPTFSRTKHGPAFHVESDFEELIASALELTASGSRLLLSTNCEALNDQALERMARYALKLTRTSASLHRLSPPIDFPPGSSAKTIWLSLN